MFTATSEKSIGARLLEHVEDLDQRPAVLAARQPDHDAIAVLDQAVLGDRLGDLLGDARFEVGWYRPWNLISSASLKAESGSTKSYDQLTHRIGPGELRTRLEGGRAHPLGARWRRQSAASRGASASGDGRRRSRGRRR